MGNTVWTKIYGGGSIDLARSVQQTLDGGYIMAGYTQSFGGWPAYVIKTDGLGDTLWTRTYGGPVETYGNAVQQTSDGGYIIAGSTFSFGAGFDDVYLIKTDAGGHTLWTKTYGGIESDGGHSVQQTSGGGFIITGGTSSFSTNGSDIWLIKTDGDGDTLWTKTFDGGDYDWGHWVRQTSDGGYIICGSTGLYIVWLIRTNANGDSLWTKTFGIGEDWGYSVQQTSDGGYIIAGSTSSYSVGLWDVWLVKVAPDITATEETPQTVINDYYLQQNYPNPFNPTTNIGYRISDRGFVSLKVYDVSGKEIATLVNEEKPAGEYSVQFDASNLSSGIYFCQMESGNFKQVRKMILMQ